MLTQADRQISQLRNDIARHRRWLHDEAGDRRAVAFHRSKIAELQAELNKLEDSQ
jgi:hypothetical protein